MPLGWIDFSKTERNKVLSVLDLLSETGTLDELGIAPIRDGFANVFFPGTSTIQTRAKYFFLVPYALKDLEYSHETNPNRMLRMLDDIEKDCSIRLKDKEKNPATIIGIRSIKQGKWVKRTPASIYWTGLRTYGIFIGGSWSLTEYIRAVCAMKTQRTEISKLGNRNDQMDDREHDDQDAGGLFHMQWWMLPPYPHNWMDQMELRLTSEEGQFLKRQITTSCPESMLAFILKNNVTDVLHCKQFGDLKSLMHEFPKEIREDYDLALRFSNFLYILRILYNDILSDGKNERAKNEWEKASADIQALSQLDLGRIFQRLHLTRNILLCRFLYKEQGLMAAKNTDGMKTEIMKRERELKQSRAKTLHPGEFDPNVWYGGGYLDYRFANAKVILRDIFESEGAYAESEFRQA